MKHKAQESLDTLECRVYTADDEICEMNRHLERCSRCDFKGALKDVQDLINCQLTVKEMMFIERRLYSETSFEKLTLVKIFNKLRKQKEMWVSDDETN